MLCNQGTPCRTGVSKYENYIHLHDGKFCPGGNGTVLIEHRVYGRSETSGRCKGFVDMLHEAEF